MKSPGKRIKGEKDEGRYRWEVNTEKNDLMEGGEW